MKRPSIHLLAALSGAGALACEVFYLRHLSIFLGDMFYAHAALLSVFLAAAAVGAREAHRFAPRLWLFELAAGLYAAALPLVSRAYVSSPLSRLFADPGLQTLFAGVLLLCVPALCLGVSLPLYSDYLKEETREPEAFPAVYGLYNLGACAGVLAAEFLIFPALGIAGSLRLLGCVNLACGVMLRLRRAPAPSRTGPAPAVPAQDLAALAIAAFAGSVLYGFYLKVCYHLFLPHRENFAVCTAASLLCAAAGAAWARRVKPRFSDCVILAAFSVSVLYAAFPQFLAAYQGMFKGLEAPPAVVALKLAAALLLGLPWAFIAAALPALLPREDEVARDAGGLLFVCGLANAAGYLAFVLLAHPRLPLFAVPALCGLALAAAAAVQAGPRAWRSPLLGICGLLLLRVAGLKEDLVYGMNMPCEKDAVMTHYKSFSDNATLIRNRRVSMVTYNGDPSIGIQQDGKVNVAELAAGVIPALLAPTTGRVLVLGMGTGITAGAAARTFSRADVVEINRGFFPLIDDIADANLSLSGNPAARLIHDDARRFLARGQARYDAVINTLPSPGYYSAGKLYTAEFLDLVTAGLVPGGVYSTWFSYGDMSNAGVRTFLATLSSRFAHCDMAVLMDSYYLLTCSDRPLAPRAFSRLDAPEPLAAALRKNVDYAGLDEYFAALFLTADVLAGSYAGTAPPYGPVLNTDDYPALEFHIRRQRNTRTRTDSLVEEPGRFNVRLPDPARGEELVSKAVVMSKAYNLLFRRRFWPLLEADPKALRAFYRRVSRYHEKSPADAETLMQLALLAQKAGDAPGAIGYCRKVMEADPVNASAAALLARLYADMGDKDMRRYWSLMARSLGG